MTLAQPALSKRNYECVWYNKAYNQFRHVQAIHSTNKTPLILVDRKRFSHATWSVGCRYMCQYTHSLEALGNGDVDVFSVGFNVSEVKDLRRKGVLIAFESGESPVHMPSPSRDQLE